MKKRYAIYFISFPLGVIGGAGSLALERGREDRWVHVRMWCVSIIFLSYNKTILHSFTHSLGFLVDNSRCKILK